MTPDAAKYEAFPYLGDLQPIFERRHRAGLLVNAPQNLYSSPLGLLVGLRARQVDGDTLPVPRHVLEPHGGQLRPPQGAGEANQEQRLVARRRYGAIQNTQDLDDALSRERLFPLLLHAKPPLD